LNLAIVLVFVAVVCQLFVVCTRIIVERAKPNAGEMRGACYGNKTCNEGLVCASDLCVRLDGGAPDAKLSPERP
jgi:hypothetical protein